jgi:hypothetical protein
MRLPVIFRFQNKQKAEKNKEKLHAFLLEKSKNLGETFGKYLNTW